MSTDNTTPEATKVWPSGQAGWYRHAKRCSWVTELTPEGFAKSWCGTATRDDNFCDTHRGIVTASKVAAPHLWID